MRLTDVNQLKIGTMDVKFKLNGYVFTNRNECKTISLFGRPCRSIKELSAKTKLFLKFWRGVTYELSNNGLTNESYVRLQCLRNCPPSVGRFSNKQKLRFCKFYSCPWCWNRKYCGNLFLKLRALSKETPGLKFYLFKHSSLTQNFEDYIDLIKHTNNIVLKVKRRRGVIGGVSLCFFSPVDQSDNVLIKSNLLIASTFPLKNLPDSYILDYDLSFSATSCNRTAREFGKYPDIFLKKQAYKTSQVFIEFLKKDRMRVKHFVWFGKLFNRSKQCP